MAKRTGQGVAVRRGDAATCSGAKAPEPRLACGSAGGALRGALLCEISPAPRGNVCACGDTGKRAHYGCPTNVRRESDINHRPIWGLAKDTFEDRIHMLGVVAEVEFILDFGIRHHSSHLGVGLQLGHKIRAFFPYPHGVALHEAIAVFP